jgi:hypothetical protein
VNLEAARASTFDHGVLLRIGHERADVILDATRIEMTPRLQNRASRAVDPWRVP